MKVRTITIGIQLEASDFLQVDGVLPISLKLSEARRCLDTIKLSLTEASYEVQTQRVALNSIEEWLICGNDPKEVSHYVDLVQVLVDQLSIYTIEFCSIGSGQTFANKKLSLYKSRFKHRRSIICDHSVLR